MLDESKCVSVGGRVVQTLGARALAIAVFSVPAGDVFFSAAPAHLYISAQKKKKTLTLICFLLLFGAFFLLFPPACSRVYVFVFEKNFGGHRKRYTGRNFAVFQ